MAEAEVRSRVRKWLRQQWFSTRPAQLLVHGSYSKILKCKTFGLQRHEGSRRTYSQVNGPRCGAYNRRFPATSLDVFQMFQKRSFVSTAFSTLLDIVPNTLDHGYNVELADGRIIRVNTILMGLEDKSVKKAIEDGPIVKDFPDVFPWTCQFYCQDERWIDTDVHRLSELNKIMVKERYPLPRIDDLFDQLKGRSCFFLKDRPKGGSVITIGGVYNEEDISKTAVRLDMDISNFQLCVGYKQEHEEHLKHKHSCGSRQDQSIKDWASPKTATEIRQFLGLAGLIIRRFIEGFSKIAKPMTKLTQKKVKFEWGDKQEAAFQLLKQKLWSAPILALPKGSEDFIVYYDASDQGYLGALRFLNAQTNAREKTRKVKVRMLEVMLIENALNFQRDNLDGKLETHRMGKTLCLKWQECGYLVMVICGLSDHARVPQIKVVFYHPQGFRENVSMT
ncbi:putative reverse transcriptase domain-containing protein [Tanacetum coccineum]